jgi:hypothetical protein
VLLSLIQAATHFHTPPGTGLPRTYDCRANPSASEDGCRPVQSGGDMMTRLRMTGPANM